MVEAQLVELRVGLPVDFPSVLPVVKLRPWDALGVIPHVTAIEGGVCYQDSEGLLLDQNRAGALVDWGVDQALVELSRGVRGDNRTDFTEEFEASWSQLKGKGTLRNVADIPTFPCKLTVVRRTETELYLAADEEQVLSFLQFERLGKHNVQRATFLPLPANTYIEPPRPDRPFWSAEELRQWLAPGIANLSNRQRRALLLRSSSQQGVIVVALPRPSQGVAVFAVRYQSPTSEHPLLPGVSATLWPLQVARRESAYLVPRGGGQASLATKHVLLVGCGAVGGRLAHDLVQSGVLRLTLVDFDMHSADNTFRHVLGYPRKGVITKVAALREELQAKYPYVQVTAVNDGIQAAHRKGTVQWNDFDLLIAATGNPTVELWLNAQLHGPTVQTSALFTWLEAYGIGGHALLTHSGTVGCLQCLYTDPDETQLANRAAFAQAGQKFSMSLAGCSARHTPYGSLDAVRTAEMAARLAVRALTNRESAAPLVSWKGDAEDFLAAGFRLAPRYAASEEALSRNRYRYQAPTCPICGPYITADEV
jgi:molybdopterin/thiamine biosynthesis adenylyltransferase